jgi:hypothetical protein
MGELFWFGTNVAPIGVVVCVILMALFVYANWRQ